MPYKKNFSIIKTIFSYSILFCLLLSGCAQKLWDEAFTEEENIRIEAILHSMQQQEQQCFQSYDADMKMFWQTPVGDNAVEGYLVLHSPSSVKFVVSNPFGQPVFAFTGNGKTFQILKTTELMHIRGNVRSLAIRNDIPLILALNDWFAYLSGRLPLRKLTVEEAGNSSSDNSIWVKLVTNKGPYTTGSTYLQINPDQKEVLSYLFLDDNGDVLAEINYTGEKSGEAPCGVHTAILLTGLPWGTEINIQVENLSGFNQFKQTDFSLPVPEKFNTQLWP